MVKPGTVGLAGHREALAVSVVTRAIPVRLAMSVAAAGLALQARAGLLRWPMRQPPGWVQTVRSVPQVRPATVVAVVEAVAITTAFFVFPRAATAVAAAVVVAVAVKAARAAATAGGHLPCIYLTLKRMWWAEP
jgi:hypothetical protein